MSKVLYCPTCRAATTALVSESKPYCRECNGLMEPREMNPGPVKFDYNDRRFLRSIRIAVDDDEVMGG